MRPWLASHLTLARNTSRDVHVLSRHATRFLPGKATSGKAPSEYGSTVHLPQTSFPMRNDPSKDEKLRKRTTSDLYKWQWENAKGPLFVLHDGPPYANGDIHIGHALNKIIKDIINRFNLSTGKRVHYIPGWDCHGLPIENKVLKELGKELHEVTPVTIRAEAEKYAKSQVASQLGQFRELGIMADWSPEFTYRTMDHEYEMRQLQIFQEMVKRGLIYRHYRPVHYSPSSRSALAEAELEYKDKHKSYAVFVSYNLDTSQRDGISQTMRSVIEGSQGSVQLLVFTTTPWTLSANMGIAVNSEMTYVALSSSSDPTKGITIVAKDRLDYLKDILVDMSLDTTVSEFPGSELAGAHYHPLFHSLNPAQASLQIVPSDHVTPDTGTGLVHCAPAHGQEDYHLFHSLGLIPASSPNSILCHVDGLGCFKPDVAEVVGEEAAKELVGKSVLDEGGKAMMMLLKRVGVVRKDMPYRHRYPYDWKTDKPVIVMATSQWFANLEAIKEDAIAALQKVQFVPEQSRNRLESHVRQRSEWCISRQRVWGVPIPALYHLPTNRAILTPSSLSHILSILQQKGTRYWWDGPVEEFVPAELKVEGENVEECWKKGTDTMDVWFDSGTSWSMLRGVRERETGKPLADVCLEGSDQHRGWFQSQLLTAISTWSGGQAKDGEKPRSPYGTLLTHGMVVDENGRKMSKSLGNIITPKTVIYGGKNKATEPAYGAETLRLWVASVDYTGEMSIGTKVLARTAETHRKIRNTLRFCLGSLEDRRLPEESKVSKEEMGLVSRYVMHRLYVLEQDSRKAYEAYDFPRVIAALSQFLYDTLSSLYITITKDALYVERKDSLARREVLTVLDQVLETLNSIIAPILPHLAEEVHQTLHREDEQVRSVFAKPWSLVSPEWYEPQVEEEMKPLLELRKNVKTSLEEARKAGTIPSALAAEVDLVVPANPSSKKPILAAILDGPERDRLDKLLCVSAVNVVKSDSRGDDLVDIQIRPSSKVKCPRCYLHTREPEEKLCKRCTEVLGV
ncbi:isoleucyl-tRNA synthetase [Panus rudis PR-1116 ss-1]|nr:isoleucyl-tRNA synthetase [Panus rudis PR-1116 ss-1]